MVTANEGAESLATQFDMVEYQQATTAYFKGVDIGYTTLRNYVILNTAFLAFISAAAAPDGAFLEFFSSVSDLVPYAGALISILFLFSLGYYNKHLENCRSRCEEIERKYGGMLFTRLGRVVSEKRVHFRVLPALKLIILGFALFWVYLAVRDSDIMMGLWRSAAGMLGQHPQ